MTLTVFHPAAGQPARIAAPAQSPAQAWAEWLRPFYESLPREPAPEKHWDLLIQLALGPDLDLKSIRAASAT